MGVTTSGSEVNESRDDHFSWKDAMREVRAQRVIEYVSSDKLPSRESLPQPEVVYRPPRDSGAIIDFVRDAMDVVNALVKKDYPEAAVAYVQLSVKMVVRQIQEENAFAKWAIEQESRKATILAKHGKE